jgi:hypothetical protein
MTPVTGQWTNYESQFATESPFDQEPRHLIGKLYCCRTVKCEIQCKPKRLTSGTACNELKWLRQRGLRFMISRKLTEALPPVVSYEQHCDALRSAMVRWRH